MGVYFLYIRLCVRNFRIKLSSRRLNVHYFVRRFLISLFLAHQVHAKGLMVLSRAIAFMIDGKQQAEDGNSPDEQDPPELSQHRGNQTTVRGKRSGKTKSNLKNSDSVSVKPSFPTKKRVQVPQCPLSETPTRPKQLLGDFIDEKLKQDSTTLKVKPVLNEKGEPVLSPFFWLSDKDAENLSEPSSVDQLNDIPSPNVPTFSDIKDSDDEDCSRLSPLVSV